jgi:hypothetical protein
MGTDYKKNVFAATVNDINLTLLTQSRDNVSFQKRLVWTGYGAAAREYSFDQTRCGEE